MLFGGLRYLTMITVLVTLFTPILFFRNGFLSTDVMNVCFDIVFFIWFLQVSQPVIEWSKQSISNSMELSFLLCLLQVCFKFISLTGWLAYLRSA